MGNSIPPWVLGHPGLNIPVYVRHGKKTYTNYNISETERPIKKRFVYFKGI